MFILASGGPNDNKLSIIPQSIWSAWHSCQVWNLATIHLPTSDREYYLHGTVSNSNMYCKFYITLLVIFDEHINFLISGHWAADQSSLCCYQMFHPMLIPMLTSLYSLQVNWQCMLQNCSLSKKLNHSTLVKQTFLTVTFMQCLMDTFWFSWYWTCVSSWRRHCLPFNS